MMIAKTTLLAYALAAACGANTAPGHRASDRQGDFAAQMVDGINEYLVRATSASPGKRAALWKRDYSSVENYERSIAPNRERLKKIIGAVDPRVPDVSMELAATLSTPALVANGQGYKVYAVRWPVMEGVTAEGLLLDPDRPPVARIVAIPDADWTPEMLAGLAPGRRTGSPVCPAARGERMSGDCAGPDRPHRHLVRHSRNQDDQPAPSRVDLPHGV